MTDDPPDREILVEHGEVIYGDLPVVLCDEIAASVSAEIF